MEKRMQLHHLNCISACPLGGLLMDGHSTGSLRAKLVSHCILVEAADTLVLIDTGYGLRDVAAPDTRLNKVFLSLMQPDLREAMTAARQIERLGFSTRDVRHIVLTHLDFDHAGGLDDFPEARVHMLRAESDDALAQRSQLDRMRYRPAQWSSQPRWQKYAGASGERWFGFDCVRQLVGLPPEILLVPLLGHTLGHAGVAVQTDAERWLLHAGDAYFYDAEMDVTQPRCTPGLRMYQALMEKDRGARLDNQRRLRELVRAHGASVTVTCAHDAREFERLAQRAPDSPAPRPSADRDFAPWHPSHA
jgi:glyoxylase-like metal-dependent hydrolase (beta-lactamase superfamily II)